MKIMNNKLAAKIYQQKISFESRNMNHPDIKSKAVRNVACEKLAKKFGIRAKCVEDIWRHKTWVEATHTFWNVQNIVGVSRDLAWNKKKYSVHASCHCNQIRMNVPG